MRQSGSCPLYMEYSKHYRWAKGPSQVISGFPLSTHFTSVTLSLTLVFLSEKEMATHSNTLAWKIPWTEEPGRLQSMGSLRVEHNWVTSLSLFTFMHWRRKWQPTPVLLPGKSHGWRSLEAAVHWVAEGQTRLSDFPFTFHFHVLEKEMATYSSVLAWRIPGTAEPGGRPSMGSHRVGHHWSDLAAAAVFLYPNHSEFSTIFKHNSPFHASFSCEEVLYIQKDLVLLTLHKGFIQPLTQCRASSSHPYVPIAICSCICCDM